MIIINADDWGRTQLDTDTALNCYREGRITSVTAMVFMADSERAADLAKGTGLGVGLHLNFTEPWTGKVRSPLLTEYQAKTGRFLRSNKYAVLIYNPLLSRQFRYVYEAQVEEFTRLYGRAPSHVDGHQHKHLCANMLLERIIPPGEKVRRSFSFWPREKSALNRMYRYLVDSRLARRYRLTDFFFDLSEVLVGDRGQRVNGLAKTAKVELMTHPRRNHERDYLLSEGCLELLRGLERGSYMAI